MKVSASFLSIKEDLDKNIIKLDKTSIDYLHLDIMDGKFVSNRTWSFKEIKKLLKDTSKPKDVHLMVDNIKKYVKQYRKLKPEFITFHYEATKNCFAMMGLIKKYGIKVGISIKPNTPLEKLEPYFKYLDLVLVMSVEPGEGGQEFIPETIAKIKEIDRIRKVNKYKYLIEVDGGVNNKNIDVLRESNVDIVVAGSYITSIKGYQRRVDKLKQDSIEK